MCGIFGSINHKCNGFSKVDEDILKRLCYIDKERGEDSTGVFAGMNSGVVYLAKEASTPEKFLEEEGAKEVFQKAFGSGAFLVGHNRKATKGDINDENAHPFHVGDIVLVHNGSLYGHKHLADTEVDSEAIAHALNDYEGEDITEVFNKVGGAYSCVWWDNRDKTLNFFRNSQRPMFIFHGASSTYFGSEALMLFYACKKSGIEFDVKKCVELPVHHHLQYRIRNNGGMEMISEPVKKDITPFTNGSSTTRTKADKGETSTTHGETGATKTSISLGQRKRMRNEMQSWLAKNPVNKQVCSFQADDFAGQRGNWLLLGNIERAPKHITVCVPIKLNISEEQLIAALDETEMRLPVVVKTYTIDHKNANFMINAAVHDEKDLHSYTEAVRSHR